MRGSGSPEVRSVRVLFQEDGSIDIKVGYRTRSSTSLPNPGTKARQNLAKRMAQYALENALGGLVDYPLEWGGFATSEVDVTDCVVVDGRGQNSDPFHRGGRA